MSRVCISERNSDLSHIHIVMIAVLCKQNSLQLELSLLQTHQSFLMVMIEKLFFNIYLALRYINNITLLKHYGEHNSP